MPLAPQAQAYLDQVRALDLPPIHQLPLEVLRAPRPRRSEPEPVARVEDRRIPGSADDLPVRVYTPHGDGPHPLLVYLHGGGWCFGDLDIGDDSCRALANGAGCVVLSVDDRLAPEHPFPTGLEDAHAATTWAAGPGAELGADGSRLAVCGESAGGNLAAAVAMLARDRGGPPIALQVLISPYTDAHADLPSMTEVGEGHGISRADVLCVVNHSAGDEADKDHPLFSVMRALDLRGLPPALVITAEYNPLRDEGKRYARRLREAGLPVTLSRYDGMIHAFFSLAGFLDGGKRAVAEVNGALRTALHGEAHRHLRPIVRNVG